jgi:hypothetical protein
LRHLDANFVSQTRQKVDFNQAGCEKNRRLHIIANISEKNIANYWEFTLTFGDFQSSFFTL